MRVLNNRVSRLIALLINGTLNPTSYAIPSKDSTFCGQENSDNGPW